METRKCGSPAHQPINKHSDSPRSKRAKKANKHKSVREVFQDGYRGEEKRKEERREERKREGKRGREGEKRGGEKAS